MHYHSTILLLLNRPERTEVLIGSTADSTVPMATSQLPALEIIRVLILCCSVVVIKVPRSPSA